MATGNTTVTSIGTISTFEDLNLNALAVAGSNIELWSLTDTTTGELTYNGLQDFSGELIASLSCTSTGGVQEFEFRVVVNGAATADAVIASVEMSSSPKIVVALISPISIVTGDTVRLQVQNVDGTSDVLVSDISLAVR